MFKVLYHLTIILLWCKLCTFLDEDKFNKFCLDDEQVVTSKVNTMQGPICTMKCIRLKHQPENGINNFQLQVPNIVTKVQKQCCSGYKNLSYSQNNFQCIPICEPECNNGKCIAPNRCECPEGMIIDSSNKKTCIATSPLILNDCNPPCENADCIKNNCICHQGYEISSQEKNLCIPICEEECVNGMCTAPNYCICNENYQKHIFHCTTNLCTRIKHYEEPNKCFPICNPLCVNAECVSPNTCSCYYNYVKSKDPNICEPKCDNCTNSKCILPNLCTCNQGYILENGECQPICTPECINSTCIEPNKCECLEGFKKNYTDLRNYTCEPICKPECIHGSCLAPNMCNCDKSYKLNSSTKYICEPICEPRCINGICIAPNTCNCKDGYGKENLSSNICTPKCYPPCVNANCTHPNVCECHNGHVIKSMINNQHECETKISSCKRKIQNGVKKLNSDCFEFDNILKTFDSQCRVHFTNTSCYDEFCHNNNKICEMFYSCEIWLDMMNNSGIVANCMWTETLYNDKKYTISKQLPIKQPDISNILYEYSFKENFDDEPCLLCFCPQGQKRKACQGDTIHFKICQCPEDKNITGQEQYESGKSFLIIITGVIILTLICSCILLILIKKYRDHYHGNVYRVTTYSNKLYGTAMDIPATSSENIYDEITTNEIECRE